MGKTLLRDGRNTSHDCLPKQRQNGRYLARAQTASHVRLPDDQIELGGGRGGSTTAAAGRGRRGAELHDSVDSSVAGYRTAV